MRLFISENCSEYQARCSSNILLMNELIIFFLLNLYLFLLIWTSFLIFVIFITFPVIVPYSGAYCIWSLSKNVEENTLFPLLVYVVLISLPISTCSGTLMYCVLLELRGKWIKGYFQHSLGRTTTQKVRRESLTYSQECSIYIQEKL